MFLQNRITKDAITEITKAKGVANIEKFMVAGASKVRAIFCVKVNLQSLSPLNSVDGKKFKH